MILSRSHHTDRSRGALSELGFRASVRGRDDQDRFWLTDAQVSKCERHCPTDVRSKR
jgi:hypothetical protein